MAEEILEGMIAEGNSKRLLSRLTVIPPYAMLCERFTLIYFFAYDPSLYDRHTKSCRESAKNNCFWDDSLNFHSLGNSNDYFLFY